jgi:hypothetical protein
MHGATGEQVPDPTTDDRTESVAERADRNLVELLQELRVAGLGIQVLFGFLLSLPFSSRFRELDQTQRSVYIADVVLAAVSTALLTGPVAYHRLTFRRHLKDRLIRHANLMAIGGLVTVSAAISLAVLLVTSVVLHGAAVPVITAGTIGCFVALWFVLPLLSRRGAPPRAGTERVEAGSAGAPGSDAGRLGR